MDAITIGKQISMLRKECRLTQERLAELLSVSPQAVSKWENGHSLPETALLPSLAQALNTSIDYILVHNKIQILSAYYGDGLEYHNVTARLNKLIQNDVLEIEVNALLLACPIDTHRLNYLIVKYQTERGIGYCFAKDKEYLILDSQTNGYAPTKKAEIIDAIFGTQKKYYNVMQKIEHYKCFQWNEYQANHQTFPSDPSSDEKEFLTFVYLNKTGIHFVTCEEGESIAFTADNMDFYRNTAGECFIPDVPLMPAFGKGQECSFGAALTAALQAMMIETDYEHVMGVSGACYRLAFCSPGWDYSSVDGLVAYDYATWAYQAFGYSVEFVNRVDKEERADVRKRILNEIKSNRPVLGINLRVAPEWGVICGYKENGDSLFCRTKYDEEILESAQYERGKHNPYEYLYVDNWPFILTFFGGESTPPTEKENLTHSLHIFVDCNEREKNGGYSMGAKAYEAWSNDLLDESWYESQEEEQIARRLSVNQFCALALYDARKSAFVYLRKSRHLLQEKADEMNQIVTLFRELSEKAQQIQAMLQFEEQTKSKKTKDFWTKEIRKKQADCLMEMCELEREAVSIAMHQLLL